MGTTFRPYQPDQVLMLPPDLREWVSEGHLAHHVSDLVDAVDLSAFYVKWSYFVGQSEGKAKVDSDWF